MINNKWSLPLCWPQKCYFLFFISLISIFAAPVLASSYLHTIDAVAQDIQPTATTDQAMIDEQIAKRELFESELDASYHGTFLFYKKLPEEDQQKIYAEYQAGIAIKEIRRIILDRFLKQQK